MQDAERKIIDYCLEIRYNIDSDERFQEMINKSMAFFSKETGQKVTLKSIEADFALQHGIDMEMLFPGTILRLSFFFFQDFLHFCLFCTRANTGALKPNLVKKFKERETYCKYVDFFVRMLETKYTFIWTKTTLNAVNVSDLV
jgi:hypothetical protein